MRLLGYFAWIICSAWLVLPVHAAERTTARLILAADSASPGQTVLAAVELQMPARWHTYWRYPGDSGSATKIHWELPEGISAGEIQWPTPEKFVEEGLYTYVYHDTVLLLVPLKLADNLSAGTKELKARVSWLECEKVCIPGKADVQGTLIVGPDTKPSANAGLIEVWQKKLPQRNQGAQPLAVTARWDRPATGDTRPLVIEWEDKAKPPATDFYPYGSEDFEVGGQTDQLAPAQSDKLALRKQVKKLADGWPKQIHGIIVVKASGETATRAIEVSLNPTEPSNIQAATGSADTAASRTAATAPKSLWKMLGLAFLGGLILNIMPCVLPVIALKILGFVNQSKEAPQRVRRLGLIYALGVIFSFLVLASLVIGVKQAGHAANWGMQFQNPQFLIGMTVLITLVALNLFGVFEINLSGRAMGAAGSLAAREGAPGAFFNGVLATALATPCTAPFLGVALGFAFAQSPSIILLTFLTIGLGLAAPYVILSWQPGWLKFLPKPGAWMERFKVAMGFPMLATAIWLFWLATSHFGKIGTLWLGLFLVVVAMAAWIWGEFVQRGRLHRGFAMGAAIVLLIAGYSYALEGQLHWRAPVVLARDAESAHTQPGGIAWKTWTPKAVEEARAAGHPVLVDFTADWCLTCQVNKKTSLEIASVRDRLKELGVVAFIGDHTNVDPAITAELNKYERAGVPLVLVYSPNANEPPIVLPEVLTPSLVLDALRKVSPAQVASGPR